MRRVAIDLTHEQLRQMADARIITRHEMHAALRAQPHGRWRAILVVWWLALAVLCYCLITNGAR
jgi:hypothetical protein